MFQIIRQLHGGGGRSKSTPIKNSAPGSTAVATIDNATADEREKVRNQLAQARGRSFTDKTGGAISDTVTSIKKLLLGE